MKTVLTDVMGTVVNGGFVRDLMHYFSDHGDVFVETATAEDLELIDKIRKDATLGTRADVVDHLKAKMKGREFHPDYLALLGKVTAQGYESGALTAPVFDDDPGALRERKQNDKGIYVFSNGTQDEQARMLRTSNQGDISGLFDGFIDTAEVGSKTDPESYRRIAGERAIDPRDIVFLSDLVTELDAADQAGYNATLVNRPGNKEQPAHSYGTITSFRDVDLSL